MALVVALGAAVHRVFPARMVSLLLQVRPGRRRDSTATAILVAFVAQQLVSMAFYRDHMLGLTQVKNEDMSRVEIIPKAVEEVSTELGHVHDFNEIVRGQLKSVIDETEKAAFSIVDRLQTIGQRCYGARTIRRRNIKRGRPTIQRF